MNDQRNGNFEDTFLYFVRRTEKDFEEVKSEIKSINSRFDQVFLELNKAKQFEVRVMAIVGLITVILAPAVTILTLFIKGN